MGNSNLLQKTCMTPTDICTSALNHDSKYEQNIILKRNKVRSTDQIKQSILKFIETHQLQMYSVRERKVLETLVSVEQQHVAQKIVQMDKRIKLLDSEKMALQKLKNKEANKIATNDKQTNDNSQNILNFEQKQSQIISKITQLKDKRKRLFEESECLLLEDLDMIFEQIPKFDQNYEYINSILSLSAAMLKSNKKSSTNHNERNLINQHTTQAKPLHSQKTQTNHTSFSENIDHYRHAKIDKKKQQKIRQLLKIYDKKSFKKNPIINSLGSQVLRTNQLLMIVPIQCFSGIGALRDNKRTGLPSGASLLQILMNKIKAVNLRRGSNLGVAFLVNQNYISKFNQSIQKITGFQQFMNFQKLQINSNLSNHESEDNFQSPIPYHVIPFKNFWPSFNAEQKIAIDSVQDQIVFSTHDGDLFAFVENRIELKSLIGKYRYVNITNINNLLSQIGDAHILGYLEERQEVDIAVKVLKPKVSQIQFKDYFSLDDQNFFSIKEVQDHSQTDSAQNSSRKPSYLPNQSFLDTEQYYVKSRIFIADSGPLKRLLMSRISRKINPETEYSMVQFYLHRSISSALYSKFTAFITVDEDYEFSYIKSSVPHLKPKLKKNGQIGYSKYCKMLLGIKQSKQGKDKEEMVEIDAGILHKGSDEIMRLISSLKKIKEVGFPIILYSDLFNNSKHQQ